MLIGKPALAHQVVRIRLADDPRGALAIARFHPLHPQLGRFDHVRIGGDHFEPRTLVHFDYLQAEELRGTPPRARSSVHPERLSRTGGRPYPNFSPVGTRKTRYIRGG